MPDQGLPGELRRWDGEPGTVSARVPNAAPDEDGQLPLPVPGALTDNPSDLTPDQGGTVHLPASTLASFVFAHPPHRVAGHCPRSPALTGAQRTPRRTRTASPARSPSGRRSPSLCAGVLGTDLPRALAAVYLGVSADHPVVLVPGPPAGRHWSALGLVPARTPPVPRRCGRPVGPSAESESIASFRLFRPTPLLRSSSARAMRSLSDRPNRSSRQTTSVSPARRCESACCRFGRSATPPAVSSKIRSHPVSLSASR